MVAEPLSLFQVGLYLLRSGYQEWTIQKQWKPAQHSANLQGEQQQLGLKLYNRHGTSMCKLCDDQ